MVGEWAWGQFGTLILLEMLLWALAGLVLVTGPKGMAVAALSVSLLNLLKHADLLSEFWLKEAFLVAWLLAGIGMSIWLDKKSAITTFIRQETGALSLVLMVGLGLALLPLALILGILSGGLIWQRWGRYHSVGFYGALWGGSRLVFSLGWLVLGNLI